MADARPAGPLAPATLQRSLVTPEGVDLRLQLASAGDRAAAFLIDLGLMLGVLIGMTILALLAGGTTLALFGVHTGELVFVIWLLGAFVLRNGWFLGFELSPRAATPGKRIIGLRVAARDGGRLRAESVFARNALRELEVFMPLGLLISGQAGGGVDGWMWLLGLVWCGVFLFMPLFNRDRLRAGDLIAGTWVVKAPKPRLLSDLAESRPGAPTAAVFTPAQLDAYGVKELQVLEQVLRQSDRRTRRAVAERIAGKINHDLTGFSDEEFLTAYYAGLRARLESRLLMGRRRKDKHDLG